MSLERYHHIVFSVDSCSFFAARSFEIPYTEKVMTSLCLHASCVALNGKAVLLAGPSGVGKSDLALRLIENGAQLVADDQTKLIIKNNVLIAFPPQTITGLMEIRHAGLFRLPYLPEAPVALYVALVPPGEKLERYPETDPIFLLDRPIQRLRLKAYESSAPAKIRACLSYPKAE